MCLPFGQIPYIYGPGNFHTITQGSSLTVFYYTSSLSVDLLKSFSFRYTIVCIIFSTFTLASAIQTDSCLYDVRTLHVINMDVWSISVESWICRSGYLPELLVSSREPILQQYIYIRLYINRSHPTSRCQTTPSIRTLKRHQPVIPGVPFVCWSIIFPFGIIGSLWPTYNFWLTYLFFS